MQLSFLLGLAVVHAALISFALGEQTMPSCAAKCLAASLEAEDVCTATNTTCICTDPALTAAIQGCVALNCTMKETLVTLNVTANMCGTPVRDNTHVVTIVAAATGSAAVFLVLLRTYTAVTAGTFGLDDGAALFAGILVVAINGLTLTLGPAGIGRDIWYLSPYQIYRSLKLLFFCQLLVWPTSAMTKMCFLFFYLRIFPKREVRIACFALMALTACWLITFEFGNIFICHPISYFWRGWDGEHQGGCINANSFIYAGSGINITIDVTIIILPLRELVKLQLSKKRKVAILAMFSVGFFTTIVAIIRLVELRHYAKTTNPTMDDVGPDVWTMIELNVGVFCVCMPSIRHFLARHFPSCFGTVAASSKGYDYTPNSRPAMNRSGNKLSNAKLNGITKTVDTHVMHVGEDDEVELVRYGHNGKKLTSSTNSNDKDSKSEETLYRQHWR